MTLFDWWDKHMIVGTIVVLALGLALLDTIEKSFRGSR